MCVYAYHIAVAIKQLAPFERRVFVCVFVLCVSTRSFVCVKMYAYVNKLF